MYVVFHCNAATPLPKRYKRLSWAVAKARKLGPGWWADTVENRLMTKLTDAQIWHSKNQPSV